MIQHVKINDLLIALGNSLFRSIRLDGGRAWRVCILICNVFQVGSIHRNLISTKQHTIQYVQLKTRLKQKQRINSVKKNKPNAVFKQQKLKELEFQEPLGQQYDTIVVKHNFDQSKTEKNNNKEHLPARRDLKNVQLLRRVLEERA